MKYPFVTVICPIRPDRKDEIEYIQGIYNSQTYDRSEMIIAADENNIGTKRNLMVKAAKGDIIVHMDSDDYYAPDWIARSVKWLLDNPKAMITGLDRAYFYNGSETRLWEYPGTQAHVCEATMTYWRKAWSGAKCFGDTSEGEGLQFLKGTGLIMPHSYIDGFRATVNGRNTCSHKVWHHMKRV